ncbi:MAG: ATP-binding cassette domain-containing protein [Slackia sp.]
MYLLSGFSDPSSGSIHVGATTCSTLVTVSGTPTPRSSPKTLPFPRKPARQRGLHQPHATDKDIARALEAVGLDVLARELPRNRHPIGAGERMLSGGQAQRVALARAFLDPSRTILLFDEPTAPRRRNRART